MSEPRSFESCAFLRDNCDGVRVEVRWTKTHVKIYEHTLDGDVQCGLTIQRGGQAQELVGLLSRGPPEEPGPAPRPYDTQLEWLEECLRDKSAPSEEVLEAVAREATATGPPVFRNDLKRRTRVLEVIEELRALEAAIQRTKKRPRKKGRTKA